MQRSLALAGPRCIREAFESLWQRRINIDVLMGVATVGSAALGLWEEAAFLAFLYAGAEGLEEYTYDRTRGAIRALLDLAPRKPGCFGMVRR